ncbi:hypothetical protein K1719_036419 [Acacia pycnantha]|nr:hypothetical protein K1719_036419 [Acacia pycnantha]
MKSCKLSFLCLALLLAAASADSDRDCVYTLYVKTGSIIKGGTDAKISVTLGDASGRSVSVPNLRSWGLMSPSHDYFERGNRDIFSGRGPCIDAPVCRLNLTSDGAGAHPSWFCDHVEVTSTGPHINCSQSIFYIDQWLANDVPPFGLTALIDGCYNVAAETKEGRFVVGNPKRSWE